MSRESKTQKERMFFKPISLLFNFIEKLWQTASNTNLRMFPSEKIGGWGIYTAAFTSHWLRAAPAVFW